MGKRNRYKSKATAPSVSALGMGPGGFEGAAYASKNRGNIFFYPAKGRQEVDIYARTELTRKMIYLHRNVPALQMLSKCIARHAVGIGLFPQGSTFDESFNGYAEDHFDNWASNKSVCDAQGIRTFWQKQRQIPRQWITKGEAFEVKVRSSEAGAPQLQTIDALEVGNFESEEEGIYDGVLVDSAGRKRGYRIPQGDSYYDISGADMMHIYDPEHTTQYRGLPLAYASAPDAQDLMELMSHGKTGVKLQNMLALAITRANANAGPGSKVGTGDLVRRKSTAAVETPALAGMPGQSETSQAHWRVLESFGGSGIISYLAPGETIQQLKAEMGDDKFRMFIELLICQIAWSIGVNPDLIFFLAKLGSGPMRGGLEDYAAFLMGIQDAINEQFNQPVWAWVIGSAIKAGKIPKCKDPAWWKCTWQGPPKVTLDLPKMGKLSIDLHDHGFLTEADYWNQQGKDWRRQQDQKIREIRRAKIACMIASNVSPAEAEKTVKIDYYADYRVARPGTTNIVDPAGNPVSSGGDLTGGDGE